MHDSSQLAHGPLDAQSLKFVLLGIVGLILQHELLKDQKIREAVHDLQQILIDLVSPGGEQGRK